MFLKPAMSVRVISLILIHTLIVTSAIPAWAKSSETPPPADAPAAPVEETDPGAGEITPDTQLAPGFLIDMRAPQDPTVSGTFRVQFDGKLDLPYSMSVDTKGMTLKRLRAEVARLYRPYFRNPNTIAVNIKQRRYWIDVRGLVTHPGTFLVKPGAALDEIIALAGGISDKLAAGFIRVEQTDGTVHWLDLNDYYKNGRSDLPAWRGADRVFFQKEGPDADEKGSAKAIGESLRKVQVL